MSPIDIIRRAMRAKIQDDSGDGGYDKLLGAYLYLCRRQRELEILARAA